MSAYAIFLYLHSWLRWAVVILGVLAIAGAYLGWFNKRPYSKGNNGISAAFMGMLHLQLVLGLVLYFAFSPLGLQAFQSMEVGEVMSSSAVRYYAVEHIFTMIVAVVIAQIGRSKSKRQSDSVKRFKQEAIFYTIAFLLIMIRIPWSEAERMFRGL